MWKWMARLDSACQKGLESTSYDFFNSSDDASTGGEVCWGEIMKSEIGHVFACGATTSDAMGK
jgi:hypothetical protein